MKFRIALPLVAAAALGLSACHKQDVANNSAAADETLTLNDEGVADNSYDAIGAGNLDAPADNALTPVDGAPAAGNGATGNAL
ncbi:hypothetical protein ACU5AX_16795 [Sphingomonas sp. XXL09]|uniref:hypothetical protein n=1 Tax=Sphingomonas sp. XXL09 TaxID=3457787 RepID=UPI00406BB743